MNDAPDRDVVVFTEALRLPAAERADYLDRACAGDGELRRRVEAVLQGYEKAGDFLGEPAAGVPTANSEGTVAGEKPGDRVGRYRDGTGPGHQNHRLLRQEFTTHHRASGFVHLDLFIRV